MPVYFADNWLLLREPNSDTMTFTFWLKEKVHKYATGIKKLQQLERKKQEVFQHRIQISKLTDSKQFGGWCIFDNGNTIAVHLNRRDYTARNLKSHVVDSDDDENENYVKIQKEFTQSPEEIALIINPPPKPLIVAEEVPDEQIGQDGWVAE